MRKISTCLITALLLVAGCKKDNSTTGDGGTFTPAFIAPTSPGYIQTSSSILVLHPGNTVNVTVQLYKSDGTLNAPQPFFLWSTGDSSVATVNNGLIKAVAEGNTLIAVSDSVHGISYVNVTVVASSVAIPNDVASISYTQPVILLQKGESKSFSYRLNNNSGQQVSGSPDAFVTDPGSGISVSANTITAGQVTGSYYVWAIVGGDTIHTPLQVVVYDPAATNGPVSMNMRVVYAPVQFWDKGLTGNKIRIEVTESYVDSSGSLVMRVFQTSPDYVSIHQSGVLGWDASGRLKSEWYGAVKYTVKYKDKQENLFARVLYPFAGKWGNADVSICVTMAGYRYNRVDYYSGRKAFSSNQVNAFIKYYFKGCENVEDFPGMEHLFLFGGTDGKGLVGGLLGQYPTKGFEMYIGNYVKKCIIGSGTNIEKTGKIIFYEPDLLEFNYGGTRYLLRRDSGKCEPTRPIQLVSFNGTIDTIESYSCNQNVLVPYYDDRDSQVYCNRRYTRFLSDSINLIIFNPPRFSQGLVSFEDFDGLDINCITYSKPEINLVVHGIVRDGWGPWWLYRSISGTIKQNSDSSYTISSTLTPSLELCPHPCPVPYEDLIPFTGTFRCLE